MQSVHLYSSRPADIFKNGDMDATFMQTSPVANSSVHLYSGRATMPASTSCLLSAASEKLRFKSSPKSVASQLAGQKRS